MIAVLLCGALAALLTRAATRGLRVGVRGLAPRARRPYGSRSTRATADCAGFLDAVASRVHTGASLTAAIVDESERCPPLRVAVERVQRGGSPAEALTAIDTPHPDVAFTVQTLSATARLGGPVAATLDSAASVLRERAAARAELRAHGAQARLSARVMTIVPVAFALWNIVVSDTSRAIYVTSPVGRVCATVGVALNVTGWRWMNRLIGDP